MIKLLKSIMLRKTLITILLALIIFNVVHPVFAISGSGSGQFVGGQFDSGVRTTENVRTTYGMLIRRLVNYSTGESITVFCAENFVNFNTGTIVNATYYPPTNLDLKQASKIAYFGWYMKHGDYVVNGGTISDYDTKMDYVFTQQYIWEALGQSNATFLDSNIQSQYENFKVRINNEMNSMQTKPSFAGQTIEITKGETKTLLDENYVLSNYTSLDKTIDGIRFVHNEWENTLNVTINNDCTLTEYPITMSMFKNWGFVKKGTEDYDTTIYFEFYGGVQNQLYAMHYNDPVALSMNLKINSYGRLELTKVNVYDELIDGAIFKVTGPDNYYNEVEVTGGRITLENLKEGTYYVSEKKAPDGYILNTNVYEVSVKPNETSYQKITNGTPTGEFSLIKKNTNGETIQGTKYKFWNDNGYNKEFTTDANGKIEIKNLELGKYYYQEIQATNGYLLDSTIYTFELTYKDQTTNVVYENAERTNDKPVGNFTLIKKNTDGETIQGTKYRIWNASGYDKEFTTDSNGKIEVKGLELGKYNYQEIQATNGYLLDSTIYTFELTYKDQTTSVVYANAERTNEKPTGSFSLIKKNAKGTKNLAGAKYRIWSANGYDKEFTTDSNGKIEVKGLELGKYNYQEIKAPNGYLLDSTIYAFELTYKDQYTRVIYANAERINEVPTGNFILTKKSKDGKTIAGTKYRIWNANGYDKEFTTDSNGKIEVKGLELGKYNYQEIQATNGYLLDSTIYTFELTYKDQLTRVVYANAEKTNDKPTGTFTLIKKNANKTEKLSNAKYRIWNDGYDKEFTTDSNGKIEIKGLELGKYNYQEIQAPYGYVIDEKVYTFELTYKDQNTSVVYANAERTNEKTMGAFTLIKKNVNKTENLSNAKYRIWNASGYDKEFTTDSNGKIEVKGLELGKYNYQEIKAPYGYVIDEKVYTFELTYKDQYTKVVYANAERTNEKTTGTFTLIKKNADSSANIEGTIYRIWNDSYDKEFTTDKNGKIEVKELELGKYYYQEIQASTGYLLDSTIYTFELTYKDQYTKVVYASDTKTNTEPVGKITIVKKDSETGSVAQGDATFENAIYKVYANEDIYNVAKNKKYYAKGDLIATRNIDKNGNTQDIENLPLGKYIVKEEKSSLGYLLDEKIYNVNLKYKDQNTKIISEIVTSNEIVKKMQVHIFKSGIKENSGLTSGLEGAEFTIKLSNDVEQAYLKGYSYEEIWNGIDKDGNKVKVNSKRVAEAQVIAPTYEIIITDKDGNAYTQNKLPYGKYIVKETKTPKDFETATDFCFNIIKDENEITEIAQKVKHLVANNEQLESYIKIIKKDLQTEKVVTLSSATFEIIANEDIYDRATEKIIYKKGETITQKIGGTIYSSFTTNADNIVIPKGSYNTENDKKGTTITPLSLPVGTYIINEINVPNGFLKLDKPVTFKIEGIRNYDQDEYGDYIKEIVIKNDQPKGTLKLNKTINLKENIDTSLIKDIDYTKISFEFIASEDIKSYIDGSIIYKKGTIIGKYNLQPNATLIIDNLYMGKYFIKEISTIDGVVLDSTEYKVTFKQKDTTTKVYTETLNIGNETTCVEFSKQDITGDNELVGATLTIIDEDGKIVDKWISSEKPHKIEGLKVNNTYILREEIAPDGFVKATEIKFIIKDTNEIQQVKMIDKVVEMSKLDIAGNEIEGAELKVLDKDNKVVDSWTSTKEPHKIKGLKENETYTLYEDYAPDGFVISNKIEFKVTEDKETQKIEMIDKVVEMSKVDIAGNEIEGAELKVLDKDNKVVDSWTSTKEPHKIKGLKENETYTLYEDYAPDGFVISNKIEFKVTEDKETQKIEMTDKIVEISKVDIAGNEIEGATLVVTSVKTKNIVDKWISTKEPHKVNGLIEGETYILHEEISINGFVKASDIEFTITEDKEIQKIDMIDKVVEIIKTDLVTGEEIEGAELKVVDEDNNVVDSWTSTKEPHKVTGLEENKKYKLIETTAPYGYEIAEIIEFEITEDKETQKIEMKDMPILKSIKLIKIDSETKETIKDNFTFGIYEDIECTKLIQEIESDTEYGTIIFENLRYNTYFVKEIKAPSDYELSEKIVKLEINDKGVFIDDIEIQEENSLYSFEFDNQKIETPKTRRYKKCYISSNYFYYFNISTCSLIIY